MKKETIQLGPYNLSYIKTRVAVIGSGTAALNAAVHLKRFEVDDVALITERIGAGTSANAGSDKQTYHRLNPTGSSADSTREMAEDLFAGGCMHGDIALVEAALSTREFYHLVEAGVLFPQNQFGEYVGFQTDHDLKGRGTSAGPKTSIMMFKKLLAEARKEQIPILDGYRVVELLTIQQGEVKSIAGLIALDESMNPVIIQADYVVYGTGGPGAMYADSVYPESQLGSLGIALKAGARAQNLVESQFGIASTQFRWNLSGSYQQVLPRYISIDPEDNKEEEFLNEIFPSAELMLTAQFLKGYQWPFDVNKLASYGSSMIDVAVYLERVVKGKRVFIDFTHNPDYPEHPFQSGTLPEVAKEYLRKSGATGNAPVDRLKQMNQPAYDLYKENGIDLEKEPLEIAVCHQHCNGGLQGSIWWESNIRNFFPVGECNGTHGLYRPGGSSLNSGQVGSLRAAELIAYRDKQELELSLNQFMTTQGNIIEGTVCYFESLVGKEPVINPEMERNQIQARVSASLGIIKSKLAIKNSISQNKAMLEKHRASGIADQKDLPAFLKNEDLLLTELASLHTACLLAESLSGSRGSSLFLDKSMTETVSILGLLEEVSQNSDSTGLLEDQVIEFQFSGDSKPIVKLVPVRPIPDPKDWFESVWKDFREQNRFQVETRS